MKKSSQKIIEAALLVALFFVISSNAFAQPMVGADMAFKNKYIWRGIPFNDEGVLWPDVWATYKGFTFIFFGSMEMTDVYANQNKFTEVDYYFDYSRAFGKINASFGYAHYTYPNTTFATTGELYGKASTDLKYVQGALIAYLDIKEAKGIYISPSVSKSFEVEKVTPTLTMSLGYGSSQHNNYWIGVDKSGLTDLTTTLKLDYTPPGNLSNYMMFTADLNYSKILSSDLADAFPDSDSNFWFGIGVNLFKTIGGE